MESTRKTPFGRTIYEIGDRAIVSEDPEMSIVSEEIDPKTDTIKITISTELRIQ